MSEALMKILKIKLVNLSDLCICIVSALMILSGVYSSHVHADHDHLSINPVDSVFGHWQVSDKKYCVYDCATYHPDYDPGVGRILNFSKTHADNGEDNCTNVNYQVRYIDRDAWRIENLINGKKIKLANKHIPTITLFCGVRNERWDKFGTWITFLDNDTILLSFRGYAIQAKRM